VRLTPADIPDFDAASPIHHAALNSSRLGALDHRKVNDLERTIRLWPTFVALMAADGSPLMDTLPLTDVPAAFNYRDPDHHLAWWAFSHAWRAQAQTGSTEAQAEREDVFRDWATWATRAADAAILDGKAAIAAAAATPPAPRAARRGMWARVWGATPWAR
jgi:hypothetical protein